MQRRVQEVIDACVALGDVIPSCPSMMWVLVACPMPFQNWYMVRIVAADLSFVACPWMRKACPPAEIWCNESQERYVLAIAPSTKICLPRSARVSAVP